MKKIFIFIFIFLFVSFYVFGQDVTYPKLTKEQFIEDFDYFYKVMVDMNPQIELVKKVTGKDILKDINSLRSQVDTITNVQSFYNLINRTTNLCLDKHLSVTIPWVEVGDIDSNVVKLNEFYSEQSRGISFANKITKYYKGKYYLYVPADLENQEEEKIDELEVGTEFISINNIPIDSFSFISKELAWDNKKNKFYNHCIATHPNNTYKVSYNGKEKIIEKGACWNFKKGNAPIDINPKVIYFNKGKILFIRIPAMNTAFIDYFKSEIPKVAKGKTINKVVIDLRLNEGGNDLVWREVLSSIISDSIGFPQRFLLKNTELIRKYTKLYIDDDLSEYPIIKLPFLDNVEFIDARTSELRTIQPDSNSINYNGKIYLLQDALSYSSTLAFVAAANTLPNKFVTIGENAGVIGGQAATPYIIMLPNSKITFRMNCMLDGNNVNKLYDLYQDRLTYPMEIDPYEYSKCIQSKKRYSKKFLYNEDSMFKKVLEIKD